MAEGFTPINTQEEFDAAIRERLARQKAGFDKDLSAYEELKKDHAGLQKKYDELEKAAGTNSSQIEAIQAQLKEANEKANKYELENLRTNTAIELGIPMDFRDRIQGTDAETIKADAEALSELIKANNSKGLPSFTPDPEKNEKDTLTQAYKEMAQKINVKD